MNLTAQHEPRKVEIDFNLAQLHLTTSNFSNLTTIALILDYRHLWNVTEISWRSAANLMGKVGRLDTFRSFQSSALSQLLGRLVRSFIGTRLVCILRISVVFVNCGRACLVGLLSGSCLSLTGVGCVRLFLGFSNLSCKSFTMTVNAQDSYFPIVERTFSQDDTEQS